MIYAATITPAAGAVVEIFDELGISPGRFTVTLHSDAPPGAGAIAFAQDAEASSTSFGLPFAEEGQTVQFVTDHDPVYVKNLSSAALAFYVLLTAVP
jgi:hypothetical protein